MCVKNKTLVDMFLQQVKNQPNSTAVIYNQEILNYSQLAKNSFDIARYLQFLSVAPDTCVGIFTEPSFELVQGVWGILISGGAYLPLSPEYPEERLKYMIENSDIRIIYTEQKWKNKLSTFLSSEIQMVTPEDVMLFHGKNTDFEWINNLHSDHLAYLIYTSGSTGKPKGVMIEHHSLVNQMNWLGTAFHLNSKSIILQKTPFCFDAAQWEILASCCGCQIVMGNVGIYKDTDQLIDTINTNHVTTLQCVPTLLQALLDTEEFSHCQTLTQIFSGGEVLSKSLAIQCMHTLPQVSLVNLYGPTECTINTSAFTVRFSSKNMQAISIGKPIDNIQYYLLDNDYNPAAVGEIAELYIGGEGLARGYHALPELTAEKFRTHPNLANQRIYKTGDLAYWNSDGTVQYVGRIDNQIKLRGFRIELDEIKSKIEEHDWVKSAAVILSDEKQLNAFVELNSKEATLMDQGNHGAHHQSKESKVQVMMQLANKGCREDIAGKVAIQLPGKIATKKQKNRIFSRKTYRFFDGVSLTKEDLLRLLQCKMQNNSYQKNKRTLTYADFGKILRYFGQYMSKERLLPKYGYASPGALYATQMYLEIDNAFLLPSGYYYYHPVYHQLICIQPKNTQTSETTIKLHFMGKKSAIEPIYQNNIQEVLEIEAGHMVGLFEYVLPEYGMCIVEDHYNEALKKIMDIATEDFYLGSFKIVSEYFTEMEEDLELYLQVHGNKIEGLSSGQYHYKNACLEKISEDIIQKKQVIAINQAVYERSSFGITAISTTDKHWMSYINLGRKLQKLQMNPYRIGLISSGYSSKTGHNLPSAKEINRILGANKGASYFFIGGSITDEQLNSRGMNEDAVHMKGPAEMLQDALKCFLPDYMVPNKIILLDQMLLTPHGKIDIQALKEKALAMIPKKIQVEPRNLLEQSIHGIWKKVIKKDSLSINDNFFELGGNSLTAVSLVNKMSKTLKMDLSLQILFQYPTIESLASKMSSQDIISRLISLKPQGVKRPIYCWPGLGGYCMNLRLLSEKINASQPFYGVQTHGVNANEIAYSTLFEMAEADMRLIKKNQPEGPYILWGYSFGARVAFEVAYQLEKMGDKVDNLLLIAPGSPKISVHQKLNRGVQGTYEDKEYVAILFSVFMRRISGIELDECLKLVHDESSFIEYMTKKNNQLTPEFVKKIIQVVSITYGLSFSIVERKVLNAPITIFEAKGDNPSFVEKNSTINHYTKYRLNAEHYTVLEESGVNELLSLMFKTDLLRVKRTTQKRVPAFLEYDGRSNDSIFHKKNSIYSLQNINNTEEHLNDT